MKTFLLLLVTLYTSVCMIAQVSDAICLSSGLIVHYVDKGTSDDRILHYYTGYFGEKAVSYYVNKTHWPKFVKKTAPFLIMLSAATIKEAFDKSFRFGDIGATMTGSTFSIVSYKITLNKEKQQRKKQENLVYNPDCKCYCY